MHVYKKDQDGVWNPHIILNENLNINNYGYSLSMNHKYIAVGLGINYDDDEDTGFNIFGYIYEYSDENGVQTTHRKMTYTNDDFEIDNVTESFQTTFSLSMDNSMIVNIRVQDLQSDYNNTTFTYKNMDYINYYTTTEAIDRDELTIDESFNNKYKVSPFPNVNDFDYSLNKGYIELVGYIADESLAEDLNVSNDAFPLIIYNDLKFNNIVVSKYTFPGHSLTGVNVCFDSNNQNLIRLIETIKNLHNGTIPINTNFEIDAEITHPSLSSGIPLLMAIREYPRDKKWKDSQILMLNSISNILIDIDIVISFGDIDIYDALDAGNIDIERALETNYTSLDDIKIKVENENHHYTLYDLVYLRQWLNKERLTSMGYDIFELATKYGIPYQTLIDLGFVWSTTSGDPHIFPVYGSKYELPIKPACYRMLQGNQFILNASTRHIHFSEKVDIINYFSEFVEHQPKLVHDGSFYKEIFLYANDNMCKFDFDTKRIQFITMKSKNYFTISTQTYVRAKGLNQYEQCEKIKQIRIKFNHSIYGESIVYLNYFSNPQIKYGISFYAEKLNNMSGLLIREYDIKHMTLKHLSQKEFCKCQKFKNPVYTDFVITSKT